MTTETQSVTFDYGWVAVFNAVEKAAQNIKGVSIKSSDRNNRTINLGANASLRSYGEYINISLVPTEDGKTIMNITSETKVSIAFDLGKHKKNIETIVNEVTRILQEGGNDTQNNKQQESAPQSGGSNSFCGNCGKKLDAGARFCGNCGFDTTGGAK